MPNFAIRVELLGSPSSQVYNTLHARMRSGGFAQTITGVDGNGQTLTSELPHGTYYGFSNASAAQIRDWVKQQTASIWNGSKILVAETSDAAWFG